MTVDAFLQKATIELRQAGIITARLDCLILLEDITGQERASLLAHPETPLDPTQQHRLQHALQQRRDHTPLAYIRGKAAFYGRTFIVSPDVLVPRPESEDIITMLQALPLPPEPRIADVGTGSGCLGITAALEHPNATVYLLDISTQALAIAAKNIQLHQTGVRVQTRQEDLLITDQYFDVVLANLPYVPDNYPINTAATHEPPLALFAGKDGLDLYRRLWEQIAAASAKPSYVLCESLPQQHEPLAALATAAGYRQTVASDFIQQFERTN